MKYLFASASVIGLAAFAAAQTPEPPLPHSWIDDVLPAGAFRPMAVDTHNCLGRYPEAEKAAHIEGITSLSYRIAEDGSVKAVSVTKSSGNKALDQAAVACVKVWQYKPALLQDKPVEVAWRNDVKWVVAVNPSANWQPPAVVPPAPPAQNPVVLKGAPPSSSTAPNIVIQTDRPPVNTITTQSRPSTPPPISSPASIGRPHVCHMYYPPDAVVEQAQGTVTLRFTIGTEGNVHDIQVATSSGYATLDDAAVVCATYWHYKPAIKENQPIAVPWKAEVHWLIH